MGVYCLTDLTYFQVLSFGMMDALMVLAAMFWLRKISVKLILIALIMLLVQVEVSVVLIFMCNRAWMKYDEPQNIVVKMKAKPLRYHIQHCYRDTTAIKELKQAILQWIVYICID